MHESPRIVTYEPSMRDAYLALEAEASAPYTSFVYESREQARSIQALLFDANLGEMAARHAVVAMAGDAVVGMMTCLIGADLSRVRMSAAMTLKREGVFDQPSIAHRTKLAGATLWQVPRDALYLARIAVAPTARRSGVGGLLLRELSAKARLAHATAIVLEVEAGNRAARDLYARAGFDELDEHSVQDVHRSLTYVHARLSMPSEQPASGSTSGRAE